MLRKIVLWLALASVAACEGQEGPGGAPGAPGADGADGPAGVSGADGADGPAGADGEDGDDGVDGADGADGADGVDGQDARTLVFEDVGFPSTDAEKRQVRASQVALVDGEEIAIDYHTLLRSGDVAGNGTFGLIPDQSGAPILEEDGSQFVSSAADFTSFLDLGNGELWAVTHFESNPGGMYLTELSQDPASGVLSATSTAAIDFSAVGGLWTPCAGSVTPWETHLGSEEYPPNARAWEDYATVSEISSYWSPYLRYFGLDMYTDLDLDGEPDNVTLTQINAVFNPYTVGFPVEVTVAPGGAVTVDKHHAMGRVALELAKVMPDERTVYLTDDGTNVGMYLFLADTPGDLSSGELFALKWYQTSPAGVGAGEADIEWLSMGHATAAEVEAVLATDPGFSDLFTTAEPVDDACPAGFTPVRTDAGFECLALVPGMELAASRLETTRYANYIGATTEFRKEEGLALDVTTQTLYVAMSEIARGMLDADPSYDLGTTNDVRVGANSCGAVYAMDLAHNAQLGSDYVAENMYAILEGVETTYPAGSIYEGNTCSVSNIANPDNVTFVDGYATLIVGEDTGSGHQNDVIWAYDLATGRLDRILSTPYGAETTSPYWHANYSGFAYLTSVVQHPFGESDEDELVDPAEADAYVGFVGPFPAMD